MPPGALRREVTKWAKETGSTEKTDTVRKYVERQMIIKRLKEAKESEH